MCIRDRPNDLAKIIGFLSPWRDELAGVVVESTYNWYWLVAVSYTHLRAHETVLDLVCRLLLEKKKKIYTKRR